ncbi:MAG: NADPH-dependent F420 reductase [Nostoc sp. EfeVER01]|uniref:NADPH-dependent F420 reductase n=1 Tax=unclassified Nostoc TaxID=2593658 RepID=UPI002AD310FA|nr:MULTISPECIES: NADPH-dependent F420 reductase [unclassified Nostoc]MDZ7943668.1 NADPH-dependent F420 reductase [Nostoc sp. EfeVER01]MDZ7991675.1 NADPH-dependent F420 reductase [Nostoc sp. EspVER01]
MNIGIIGSGNIGGSLGNIWAKKGHKVMFSGSRDRQKLQEVAKSAGENASIGSVAEAAQFGEVILLAVPWLAVEDALACTGTIEGKILIDSTNPIESNCSGLLVGWTNSGGEEVAKHVKGARVVKAFNIVAASIFQSESRLFGSERAVLFYCGDDKVAKIVVASLIEDVGFEPMDVGPLSSARFLEPMEQLYEQIVKSGVTKEFAFTLARR